MAGLSSMDNVKRTLDNYVNTNLFTTEGIDIDFEGVPFDNKDKNEWVQVRILNSPSEYVRQASGTEYGEEVSVLFQINIFVKKSAMRNASRHYNLRDVVASYFSIGRDIMIKDYVDDSANLENMRVRRLVTDLPMPETESFYQYALAWDLVYTRRTTSP